MKTKVKLALGLALSIAAGMLLEPSQIEAASQVSGIEFKSHEGASEIQVRSDSPITYETQENSQDKQIVIELKDSQLSKSANRKLDTSSFNSSVTLVSPYQVEGQADTARIVIQLRERVSPTVSQDGNVLKIAIPTAQASGVEAASPATTDGVPQAEPELSLGERNLDQLADGIKTKRFTGKHVTLQVRDADIGSVLRLIGEASGFNIILGEGVKGNVTLSLVDVPWDQALDVILNTMRLSAERSHNILRILTLENFTGEKVAILNAKRAAENSAPRVTRIFPISFADAPSLAKILSKFGKSAGVGGGAEDNVQIDSRTNSLIVQDIPENVEKMKKLIELLDTQTPQVLVEAKIVEASEGFAHSLGGNLGLSDKQNSGRWFASFAGSSPENGLFGGAGIFPDSKSLAGDAEGRQSTGTNIFGLSPTVSFLRGIGRINAILKISEEESKTRVISAPKLVVLNKKTAKLIAGEPVKVPISTTTSFDGTISTSFEVKHANLSLDVTPTVTNSGSILLQLNVSRDVLRTEAVAPRNMSTDVLVENGTTLVIGGIYSMDTIESAGGFPFLRKIPILGALFGNEGATTKRSELIIFITPRIVNEKEAGLVTDSSPAS